MVWCNILLKELSPSLEGGQLDKTFKIIIIKILSLYEKKALPSADKVMLSPCQLMAKLLSSLAGESWGRGQGM